MYAAPGSIPSYMLPTKNFSGPGGRGTKVNPRAWLMAASPTEIKEKEELRTLNTMCKAKHAELKARSIQTGVSKPELCVKKQRGHPCKEEGGGCGPTIHILRTVVKLLVCFEETERVRKENSRETLRAPPGSLSQLQSVPGPPPHHPSQSKRAMAQGFVPQEPQQTWDH